MINNLNENVIAASSKHFPSPVKDGNSFLYWCEDENCVKKYDPTTSDLSKLSKLYVHFGIKIIVSFDSNEGSVTPVSPIVTVVGSHYGDSLSASQNKTGFEFVGWFTERDGGTEVNSSTIVSKQN